MAQLADRAVKADEHYFKRLVAKAILWRRSERLIAQQEYGGYRANLVAYTIAKLSHSTQQRLDLGAIWEAQGLDADIDAAVVEVSGLAWKVIVEDAPAGANITEWAKRKQCWDAMRAEGWDVSPGLAGRLLVLGGRSGTDSTPTQPSVDDPAIAECMTLGGDGWLALSNWAKETSNLVPWHRKLAYDIGVRMKRGGSPSVKQALHGKRVLEEARRLGFVTEDHAQSAQGLSQPR